MAEQQELKKGKEIETEAEKFEGFKIHGKQSKNIIVSWGSTKGAILDAMDGINAEFLQVKYLEPFPKKIKKEGISISISTFGDGPPKIKVTQLGNKPKLEVQEEKEKLKPNTFTKERIKKFTSLKKEEPQTNIRRLSNKVIYELEMPGVKSIDDISIIKLENSIEIKAVSKNKAYVKIIPINLPITDYGLSEGKLILELGVKN